MTEHGDETWSTETSRDQSWVEPLLDLRESARGVAVDGWASLPEPRRAGASVRRLVVVACALGLVAIAVALVAPLVV